VDGVGEQYWNIGILGYWNNFKANAIYLAATLNIIHNLEEVYLIGLCL
jgi:hypothetical protein